jgi:phosphatidylinositol alpha-mannosyltransferase
MTIVPQDASVYPARAVRIAMYHGTLPAPGRKPGGVDVFVHRLSETLIARGHQVEVISHMAAPPGASYSVRHPPLRAARSSKALRQYVASMLLNLQSFAGFDVAHFHGDDWFLWRRPLPVVRTFHGSALLEARTAASWRRRIDKTIVFGLELLAARLATGVYGVGVDSEVIYKAEGVLPIGVDIVEGDGPRASKPTIAFIGAWEGRKRGALLHRVFTEEVRPALPDAELWMVCDACEPAEGVHWMQAPSDEEVSDLLRRAWVFCLPSSYEGFGIPYLEAMAHGVPVVASSNPGSRGLLAEGRYGVLAEDEKMGGRLVELLGDAELRASIAAAGRERAGEYSWERIAEGYEKAYRQAIERWRGS